MVALVRPKPLRSWMFHYPSGEPGFVVGRGKDQARERAEAKAGCEVTLEYFGKADLIYLGMCGVFPGDEDFLTLQEKYEACAETRKLLDSVVHILGAKVERIKQDKLIHYRRGLK